MKFKALVIAGAALASLGSSSAGAADFLFEGLAQGPQPSVVQTDGGITLTVTSEGGGVVYVGNPSVPLLGTRGVVGNAPLSGFSPLRFAFDQAIGSATFDFGDSGGDDDTPVTVDAYNAFDVLLGTASEGYGEGFGAGKSLTLNVAGASYFVLRSPNLVNPNSVFWQARDVTVFAGAGVPEPATWAMLLAGFALVGGALRRPARRALKPA